MDKIEWRQATLEECAWPCLKASAFGHTARVWRGSPHTTSGHWMFKVDDKPLVIVRGNLGTAKMRAQWAMKKAAASS